MKNSLVSMARPGDDRAVGMAWATVTGRAGQWFFLDAVAARACRAPSCLIEPDCGDTVLVCHGGAVTYVLAVLAQAAPAGAAIVLPGGAALHTADGALRIEASRIELSACEAVAVEAPKLALAGLLGELKFHRLDASISEAHARIGMLSTVANRVTSTIGRLVQKTRDSFRWTANLDETRAGRVRVKVEERLHVTARHASLLADGQMKIDGAKVDIG